MTTKNGKRLKNLRGRSFRAKNLAGEDFSNCDIRGADFTNATLTGAKFCNAEAGQQLPWLIGIVLLTVFLALIAGYVSAYAAGVISSLMVMDRGQPIALVSSVISLLVLAVLMTISIQQGLGRLLGSFCLIFAFTIVLIAGLRRVDETVVAIVQSVAIAGGIAGSILAAITLATLRIIFRRVAVSLFLIATILGSLPGGWEGLKRGSEHLTQGLPATVIITIFLLGFSIYIGLYVNRQDRKYWLIYKTANFIAAWGGTKFHNATLIDADFTNTLLTSTDFSKATLTRTCWLDARNLDLARVEGTYLEDSHIRQLVISKESNGQHFEHYDLRGINLSDRILEGIYLTGANLSEATLENTNLTRARLVGTQLYRTNLNGAILTGAYIENWGISTDTQLNSIQCDYIHMRLPTETDSDDCRKPDNRKEIFQPGDFQDFIAPIIKTLDLYKTQNLDLRDVAQHFRTLDLFFYGGIDPTAAALALQQLSDRYPEANLGLLAIEALKGEKLRLQTKVAQNTDRSELYTEYFTNYHAIQALPGGDVQALLGDIAKRDERIFQIFTDLSRLIADAIKQPKFYTEIHEHTGELIMESKGNISISNVKGDVSGIAAAGENQTMTGVAIGTISGSVTNTINQLPASPDPDSPGIKELLAQLQTAIEAESELPDDDKAEALEQVKTLAEAGQKPEDNALKKAAKTSMKILKGTVSSLPDVAKLAESCAKLLPAIATLLALI